MRGRPSHEPLEMSKLFVSLLIALVVTMPAVGVFARHGAGGLDHATIAKAQHDEGIAVGTRSSLSSQRLMASFQRFFTPAGERAPMATRGAALAQVALSLQRMPHPPVPAGDVVLRI